MGVAVLAIALIVVPVSDVLAEKTANVRATRHNLSATAQPTVGTVPARDVVALSESQVCVFCHTPHGASNGATPLWNRGLSAQTYTRYTSGSLDADPLGAIRDTPDGSSRLCLSCHDGTLAVGSVNVLNGEANGSIALTGAGVTDGKLSSSSNRNLGTDLRNDHPISVAFTNALAVRDGELRRVDAATQRWPASAPHVIGVRGDVRAALPLERQTGSPSSPGEVQCGTCHDPHLWESDPAKGNQKFLRLNRFQEAAPTGSFNQATDNVCLACHDKDQGRVSWAFSAHANPNVRNGAADYVYNDAGADAREFPRNLPVWKAACLNCHDTHTGTGSQRLLRNGAVGGKPAIEETCYQCHAGTSALAANTGVPDIRADFQLTYRMPITTADQGVSDPVHNIGSVNCTSLPPDTDGNTQGCGKDFVESAALLGAGNRHVECTDCHNPHRVLKSRCFNGASDSRCEGTRNPSTPASEGTHVHDSTQIHTNVISGALRGSWGVEPSYTSESFNLNVTSAMSFTAKRGDPPNEAFVAVDPVTGRYKVAAETKGYVTREYQICLKCHSAYAYGDTPPLLNASAGRGPTASGTNGVVRYTDQAREFQAPATHMGEPLSVGTSGGASLNTNNHRSWHPVIDKTGRTLAARGITGTTPFRNPWNNVGTQAMYCTDCHGSNSSATSVVPAEGGNNWGPHGSSNPFLLKGVWGARQGGTTRGGGATANFLCFKCHEPAVYTGNGDTGRRTGFYNSSRGNLHNYHSDKVGKIFCTWCHAAVPHGWKNKALLVNLNDVGPEVGMTAGTEVCTGGNEGNGTGSPGTGACSGNGIYNNPPYYLNAFVKIRSFAASGSWAAGNCRSATSGSNDETWMKAACAPPE